MVHCVAFYMVFFSYGCDAFVLVQIYLLMLQMGRVFRNCGGSFAANSVSCSEIYVSLGWLLFVTNYLLSALHQGWIRYRSSTRQEIDLIFGVGALHKQCVSEFFSLVHVI